MVKFLWKMPLSEIQGNRRLERPGAFGVRTLKALNPLRIEYAYTPEFENSVVNRARERERERESRAGR